MSGFHYFHDLPGRVILTGDPLRVKMLAAHHLENAELICEQDGVLAYTGSYDNTAIALIAAGFEDSSAQDALLDAMRLIIKQGASEVVFLGVCKAEILRFPVRTVLLVEGGSEELLNKAAACAAEYKASGFGESVLRCGAGAAQPENNYAGSTGSGQNCDKITELKIELLYKEARAGGAQALAVLTVAENSVTGEKMEEHERRSRFYTAARLAFDVLRQ